MQIVITTDGSDLAGRALLAAAPLAAALDAGITLLTVLDPGSVRDTISVEPGPDPGGADERARLSGAPVAPARRVVEDRGTALESARVASEGLLREQAALYLTGVTCDVRVEWSEHPADAIIGVARELGAGLVVMSTHGRSGLSQVLLGSTTASVVRHSPVPVVVVGAGVEPTP